VSGQVEAWGAGQSGELGNGKTSYSDVPVAVSMPPGVNVTAVMAGGFESGAVDAKGNVWMWGRDDDDQLGSGPKSSGTQLTPVEAASTRSGQRVQLILTGTASNVIVG
jgi:alpha-tubulin suppressor-like RCC1 family protein